MALIALHTCSPLYKKSSEIPLTAGVLEVVTVPLVLWKPSQKKITAAMMMIKIRREKTKAVIPKFSPTVGSWGKRKETLRLVTSQSDDAHSINKRLMNPVSHDCYPLYDNHFTVRYFSLKVKALKIFSRFLWNKYKLLKTQVNTPKMY